MTLRWKSAVVCGSSATLRFSSSQVRIASVCSWKSNSIENVRAPCGIGPVVSPRGLTYSVTCQEWLIHGVWAMRILPTICVHMCSVASVSFHGSYGRSGQRSRSGLSSAWAISTPCV